MQRAQFVLDLFQGLSTISWEIICSSNLTQSAAHPPSGKLRFVCWVPLKKYFPRQSLKRFTFCVKLSDSIFFLSFSYGQIKLTWKANLLSFLRLIHLEILKRLKNEIITLKSNLKQDNVAPHPHQLYLVWIRFLRKISSFFRKDGQYLIFYFSKLFFKTSFSNKAKNNQKLSK